MCFTSRLPQKPDMAVAAASSEPGISFMQPKVSNEKESHSGGGLSRRRQAVLIQQQVPLSECDRQFEACVGLVGVISETGRCRGHPETVFQVLPLFHDCPSRGHVVKGMP